MSILMDCHCFYGNSLFCKMSALQFTILISCFTSWFANCLSPRCWWDDEMSFCFRFSSVSGAFQSSGSQHWCWTSAKFTTGFGCHVGYPRQMWCMSGLRTKWRFSLSMSQPLSKLCAKWRLASTLLVSFCNFLCQNRVSRLETFGEGIMRTSYASTIKALNQYAVWRLLF